MCFVCNNCSRDVKIGESYYAVTLAKETRTGQCIPDGAPVINVEEGDLLYMYCLECASKGILMSVKIPNNTICEACGEEVKYGDSESHPCFVNSKNN